PFSLTPLSSFSLLLFYLFFFFFSFNAPSPTEIYTLSLHDALPIYAALLLAGADRAADRLQAADGLAVPVRLHLQHRLRVRLRPCADRGAGAADSPGQGDDRQPARLAARVVTPDRRRAQGRSARGPELDCVRARERDRLPHLHR